ncbi:MAG: TAXI family TRAP transporter solute-binding subunit [Candidatus Poribacteria bacterium]|nr:TAXI family TRAP transporter solute-binding subunit [Candidatus Poribacteria bacterium]
MHINFRRFSEAQIHVSLVGTIALLLVIAFSSCERIQKPLMTTDTQDASQTTALTILGGSLGGSFSPFATAVRDIVTQREPQLEISVETSPGSVENTRRVNENSAAFGVAFASESHLGYHGQEVFAEEGAKTNIRAVTLLYIAYAQTTVLANSDIHQFEDLVGKKIANGRMGSGSAQTMERLAKSVGIWDQIIPVYKSSNEGAAALQTGEADAFQMLVSVPNDAMAQLAATNEIRMLDMDAPAQASGFYEQYPFYLSGTLPEGAYGGKVAPVNTLLMPTLLIAHKDIPAEIIYAILQHVYTSEGLQAMQDATGGAAADIITVENAPEVFVIPLHLGAYQFWNERGLSIPTYAMSVD